MVPASSASSSTGRCVPDVQVGSQAELWGTHLPVEELAELAGTIPYELLCGVSQRVPIELV